jgi:hypothetical protein
MEIIEHDGVRYAEVIRADERVDTSTFFSPPESSLQFGLLSHRAGFYEAPHDHKAVSRHIRDCQQMLVVQRGALVVEFFDAAGERFRDVRVGPGDAILLVHGAHAVRVLEDMQCVSVKQGPFLGAENDKVELPTGRA